MKLTQLERDALLRPLQAVSGIVERRHTLPILSNILLECEAQQLRLMSTDLEIQVSTAVACETPAAARSITVSARKLLEILRALEGNSAVSLEEQNNRLAVKAGRSRFSLQTLPAEDFPRLAESAETGATFRVSQKRFKSLLALVQYAMAEHDIRYYLNGLLLVVDGDQLRVVATDGHRLAYASMDVVAGDGHLEVILPRKAIQELVKLLGDDDAEIELSIGSSQVRFSFSGIVLLTKVVDGKFPDYTRVVPTGYKKAIEVNRAMLLQALQRAAILSNEKFRGVRWILTENSLCISCTNTDQEEAQEELEVQYGAEALDIGFNVNYLLDVLNNIAGETVRCAFGDASSSVLMTVPDHPTFKYVIMPMRI